MSGKELQNKNRFKLTTKIVSDWEMFHSLAAATVAYRSSGHVRALQP